MREKIPFSQEMYDEVCKELEQSKLARIALLERVKESDKWVSRGQKEINFLSAENTQLKQELRALRDGVKAATANAHDKSAMVMILDRVLYRADRYLKGEG